MTRIVPLKAGISKSTDAVPSAAILTMPEEQRQRLLGRRRRVEGGTAVAARAELAALALHAVDQHAIDVAQFRGEPLLVEVVVLGRRRIVARQVQDADVDSRNRDEGLLVGGQIVELDRNVRRWRGFIISGAVRVTSMVRAARSMPNQATPTARAGMRLAWTSIGR